MTKKMKTLLITLVCVLMVGVTASCSLISNQNSTTTKVNVEVTNEITNKVVDYQSITITDMENAVEETITAVERTVVGISLKEVNYIRNGLSYTKSEDTISIGSGVIYKREEVLDRNNNLVNYKYYVITNRHVILATDNSKEHVIYVYDGYEDVELPATLIGYDSKVDIALVTFEHTTYIDPVEFADSNEVKKGSFVIAIGNPEGFDYYGSATLGIVSSGLRYISDDTDDDGINDFTAEFIQHDASINPGNSGGGLFTLDGKLLGINTLKLISNNEIDNMGFAIPSNVARIIVTEFLEQGKEIVRPRLGITGIEVKSLTPSIIDKQGLESIPETIYTGTKYGVYVSEVTYGGTIAASNVESGDIILEIDGEKITSMNKITARLNSLVDYKVGDQIKVTYYDRSKDKVVDETVTLKSGR